MKIKHSINELTDCIRQLGLGAGDVVLVHSKITSLIRSLDIPNLADGPRVVFEVIRDILGPQGTLILPTFNFDFCKGIAFDIRSSPSQMGMLTDYMLSLPGVRRTFHPIYSFAIYGKLSAELGNLRYKSCYGMDSLFAKLCDLDAKIMTINLTYNHSMTFFHHVEETQGCDYRYHKEFTGRVTDETGRTYQDTWVMFARKLDQGVVTDVDPIGQVLEDAKVIKAKQLGTTVFKLGKARDIYKFSAEYLRKDPFLFHKIKE